MRLVKTERVNTSHYSKSQIFVQKFNFDKTPTFHEFFTPKFFDNFSREIKVVNSQKVQNNIQNAI